MTWRYALTDHRTAAARPRHHGFPCRDRRSSSPTGTLLNEDAKRRSGRPPRSHGGRSRVCSRPIRIHRISLISSFHCRPFHVRLRQARYMRPYAEDERVNLLTLVALLAELVSVGGSLNRKGPILLMVDVWRKQHNDLPKTPTAKLFSNSQALMHNGHVGTY